MGKALNGSARQSSVMVFNNLWLVWRGGFATPSNQLKEILVNLRKPTLVDNDNDNHILCDPV